MPAHKTISELKAQTRPAMKGNRVRGKSSLSKGYGRKTKGKKYSTPGASYAARGMLGSSAASFAMGVRGLSSQAQSEAAISAAGMQAKYQREALDYIQQAHARQSGLYRQSGGLSGLGGDIIW